MPNPRTAHLRVARKKRIANRQAKRRVTNRPNPNQPHKGHKQGYYTPKHPEKYVGNVNNIRYMSSWELDYNKFLDNNPNILRWSSEELVIPYIKPTDGRVHKYYPDYWVEYKNRHGQIIHEVIEVKPEKQTKQPTTRGKSKKTQIYESITWAVNTAKWEAAQKFCDKYGWVFRIVTEKDLFR